jgi:carbamoyltransferase
MYSDQFVAVFGRPREDEPLTERHQKIAAALQRVFEDSLGKILTALQKRTGIDRLVASGGCFMNSVFNGRATHLTPFKQVFLTSCPDDSGTSVGAALYLHAQRTKTRLGTAMTHNYWGRSFSDAECKTTCERFKLPHEVVVDPSEHAAGDVIQGKVVGWFQGGAEFGQRALGNRSILVDARRDDAKDLVNSAVKYRESFRPFAPAILAERAFDYFECERTSRVPFMEKVFPFREERKSEVPAVVHVDGTGRLQTVDGETNPRFRALIEHFDKRTGVPIVLNTSFNLNGEPIVYTPEDAVRTFFSCGLDVLYLGNVRISK